MRALAVFALACGSTAVHHLDRGDVTGIADGDNSGTGLTGLYDSDDPDGLRTTACEGSCFSHGLALCSESHGSGGEAHVSFTVRHQRGHVAFAVTSGSFGFAPTPTALDGGVDMVGEFQAGGFDEQAGVSGALLVEGTFDQATPTSPITVTATLQSRLFGGSGPDAVDCTATRELRARTGARPMTGPAQ